MKFSALLIAAVALAAGCCKRAEPAPPEPRVLLSTPAQATRIKNTKPLAEIIVGHWESIDATQVHAKAGIEQVAIEFTKEGKFALLADGQQTDQGTYRFEEDKLKMLFQKQGTEDRAELTFDGDALTLCDATTALLVKLKKAGTYAPSEVVKLPPAPPRNPDLDEESLDD